MSAFLMQMGTVYCESERLKISGKKKTSASRWALVFNPQAGMFPGPAALLVLKFRIVLLTSAVVTDSGWSSGGRVGFTAYYVDELKVSINWVYLIQQRGLTHNGGISAFAAYDILNRPPRIFSAAGVGVAFQCLLTSPLATSFQSDCGGVVCFHVTWQTGCFVCSG